LIVTVGRQGYQFTGDVTPVPPHTRRYDPTRWRAFAVGGAALLVMVIGVPIAWQRLRGAPTADTVRLAVLPFMNLTGDSTENDLADELTEETITQLARLRPEQLRVIARTSVMGYKRGEQRIDEIGRDLSVGYALESSLRQSANRLRVTVQLIDVKAQPFFKSVRSDPRYAAFLTKMRLPL
jgi:TolB-like protein